MPIPPHTPQTCRWHTLLEYYGERPDERCGSCDVCKMREQYEPRQHNLGVEVLFLLDLLHKAQQEVESNQPVAWSGMWALCRRTTGPFGQRLAALERCVRDQKSLHALLTQVLVPKKLVLASPRCNQYHVVTEMFELTEAGLAERRGLHDAAVYYVGVPPFLYFGKPGTATGCSNYETLGITGGGVVDTAATDIACEGCGGTEDEEGNEILLCDGCNAGCHLRCIVPQLPEVPEGPWCAAEMPEMLPSTRGDYTKVTPLRVAQVLLQVRGIWRGRGYVRHRPHHRP